MTTTRVPLQHCPECDAKLDSAGDLTDNYTPRVGDFAVCIVCTAILIYEVGMMVRLASKDELRALPAEVLFSLVRYQVNIREMHRQRQRDNYANN